MKYTPDGLPRCPLHQNAFVRHDYDLTQYVMNGLPVGDGVKSNHRYTCNECGANLVDPGPLPAEHLHEYDAAAEWCAERGLAGKIGDPLPPNMRTNGALKWIQDDPEAFAERVRQIRYALSMTPY